jgi:hypothetical protein
MLRLKKAARPRTKLQKHNNQDTRVTVESQCSQCKKSKGERWKSIRRGLESFLIRQVLIDVWENRHDYWKHACEFAIKLFEALGS